MTITVNPTTDSPTHDISLTDGSTTYGLRAADWHGYPNISGFGRNPSQQHAFKTTSGASSWADIKPPYSAVCQDDWSGGFGNGEFERNTSGYKIAHGINTMSPNKAFLGPRPTFTTGYTSSDISSTSLNTYIDRAELEPLVTKHAVKFTASASYTTAKVYVYVGKYGSPATASLRVGIWSDTAGTPNAELAAATGAPTTTNILGEWWEYSIATALTASTDYWVVVSQADATSSSYWWVGGGSATGGKSYVGSSWVAGPSIWFSIMATTKDFTAKFAEYKGLQFAALSYEDGTANTLYRNGYQGVADSATTVTLTDAAQSWTVDALIGGVVQLRAGTGSNTKINYRTITDNTATVITVSPAWDINPSTDTEYSITGVDMWNLVASSATYLAYKVTDVLSINNGLYFAMGTNTADGVANVMYRYRAYNNSGTWTEQWSEESQTAANKFDFLTTTTDTDGKKYIWGASSRGSVLRYAEALDCSGSGAVSDLSWNAISPDKPIGDIGTRIMGIEKYGSPQTPWALKEDMIHQISEKKPTEMPLGEMRAVKSEDNGWAHCTQGVYLYFSLGRSIERYFNNNLDDINPNRDVGMPSNQRGSVSAMVSYPGKIYFSIDAGTTGYSSIVVWDGVGFHEYYRGEYGKRVKSLSIQTIPGATVDRLWFSEGNKIKWLPIAIIPFDDSSYPPIQEGFLETSWIYSGVQDVYKTYKSLKLFMETKSSAYYITAYYMKDDDDKTWTLVPQLFDTAPSEEVNFTTPIAAKRIKLGLLFTKVSSSSQGRGTTDYYTPYLRAWILTGTMTLPVKWVYTLRYMAQDEAIDREGDDDSYTAIETIINQLDTWAAAGTPLTMRSIMSWADSKTVIIDPQSVTPIMVTPDDQMERAIAQVQLLEV